MKKAIVFGATGFIGSLLLEELLSHPAYEKVTIVVRRDPGIRHDKLVTLIGDYTTLPSLSEELVADDVFLALGTTRKNTPDERLYYTVDHDYPLLAARLAQAKGARTVVLVSSVGADLNSGVFYLRTKAETERDLKALQYPHTHIFRPSLLMGARKEKRGLERFLIGVFGVTNPLLAGPLNKFRGIDGRKLARAMVKAAQTHHTCTVYHWKEINRLLR